MKTLDEVPQFHSGMMSQIRQNRDFTLNLAVGTKTIGNCAFALVFGLVAARFGERLDRRRRRDEMKPDAP
jgi:hypothetical protein